MLFRALYALWSKTGDTVYLEKMREHYLNDKNDYSSNRDVVNVEMMLRRYEYFDDERLLQKAQKAYEGYNAIEEIKDCKESIVFLKGNSHIHDHGVTFNETAKIAAIMYLYTAQIILGVLAICWKQQERENMLIK